MTGKLEGGLQYALLPRRTKGDRVTVVLRLQWGDLANLSRPVERRRHAGADDADRHPQPAPAGFRGPAAPARCADGPERRRNRRAAQPCRLPRTSSTTHWTWRSRRCGSRRFQLMSTRSENAGWSPAIQSRRDQPDSLVADVLRRAGHDYPPADPRHYRHAGGADCRPAGTHADGNAGVLPRLRRRLPWPVRCRGRVRPAGAEGLAGRTRSATGAVPAPTNGSSARSIRCRSIGNSSRWPTNPMPSTCRARAIELSQDDPDYPALALAMRMFGGDSGSRVPGACAKAMGSPTAPMPP